MLYEDREAERCIDALQACYAACMRNVSYGNVKKSGPIQEEHVRLMLDCAEMCQTAANFLIRESDHYLRICREAAEICKDLASSCEGVDGMDGIRSTCDECVSVCRVIVG